VVGKEKDRVDYAKGSSVTNEKTARRVERGWPGHFICASRCAFRRNTLVELGDSKVVVSTVGSMRGSDGEIEKIGLGSYYETKAFIAMLELGMYWDADVTEEIDINSAQTLREASTGSDALANNMHEDAVTEIAERMEGGEF